MESYLKFLEEKVDKIIRDMASVHILRKEVKELKEENQVFKNLVFGSPEVSSLSSELTTTAGCYSSQPTDYTMYNKTTVQNEVANKGCLLKRMDKMERNQTKIQEFGKEVDFALDSLQQRITNQLTGKVKEQKPSTSTMKLNKDIGEVTFNDPKRQLKNLKKLIKKQGSEIAKDISKLEKSTQKLEDEIKVRRVVKLLKLIYFYQMIRQIF